MSENEFIKSYKKMMEDEEKMELVNNSEIINNFIQFANKKNILLNNTNFSYIRTIGIVVTYPDIVIKILPKIKIDKEELVNWNEINNVLQNKYNSGYLYHEKMIIMAHPFFRRGFYTYNNFAPLFVDLFWKKCDKYKNAFIAIDKDRLRINLDDLRYTELDTWYGSKFNKNINDIKDGPAKLKPPVGYDVKSINALFHDNYSLDILWKTNGNIRIFQLEEFKSEKIIINYENKVYHPVRYIHAEYDVDLCSFRHFDGAVHLYKNDEYFARRDSDMNFNYKTEHMIKSKSVKLFKFNETMMVDEWIEYASQFLTGNPLVCEYFQGEYPEYIKKYFDQYSMIENK